MAGLSNTAALISIFLCILTVGLYFKPYLIKHYISSADASFKARFLAKHNEYRMKHGAPALSMSKDLCTSAQAWADHLLSIKTLQHSDTNKGENLYYFQSSAPKKLTGKSEQYNINLYTILHTTVPAYH